MEFGEAFGTEAEANYDDDGYIAMMACKGSTCLTKVFKIFHLIVV